MTVVTAGEINGPYNLVLVTVKNGALESAMDDMAPAVGPGTLIVPFLNGMSHLDRLNQRFGVSAVLGGVVIIATTVNQQGDIVRLAPQASLTTGAQPGPRRPTRPGSAAALATWWDSISRCPPTSRPICGRSGCSSPPSAPSPA